MGGKLSVFRRSVNKLAGDAILYRSGIGTGWAATAAQKR